MGKKPKATGKALAVPDKPGRRGPKLKGPTTEEDFEVFESLCKIQCTMHEIAAFFNCDTDTLAKRVQQYYGGKFSVIFRGYRKRGLVSLRRVQYEKAIAGNVPLLVWLGKQYLGQSEEPGEYDKDPPDDERSDEEVETEILRRMKRREARQKRGLG